MATAINDFIQGIIMLAGIIAIIVAVLHSKGGFMAALDGLGHVSDPTVSSTPGVFGSFFGPDPVSLLSVVILTSLGIWGLPQMVQKFYAIDNEDSIKKGTIISTIFALVVSGGCYFLGGFGRLFSVRMILLLTVTIPLFQLCLKIYIHYLLHWLLSLFYLLQCLPYLHWSLLQVLR